MLNLKIRLSSTDMKFILNLHEELEILYKMKDLLSAQKTQNFALYSLKTNPENIIKMGSEARMRTGISKNNKDSS